MWRSPRPLECPSELGIRSALAHCFILKRREKEIKKMIKKIINIALVIALTAALAGCGSKSASKDTAGDSAAAQSTAAQTAAVQENTSDQSDDIEDGSEGENTPKKAAESGQEASAESIEIPEIPYVRDDGGVTMDVFAMDTYMNLLAYGDNAEEAVVAAAAEIHRLDDMLSTGNAGSEISKLNAAGEGEVSDVVLSLIEESQVLYKDTGGLFDIAIYPVMKLWGFPNQEFRIPEKAEIDAALKLADASKITIGAPAAPAAGAAEKAANTTGAPEGSTAAETAAPEASEGNTAAETAAPEAPEGNAGAEAAVPEASEGNTGAETASAAEQTTSTAAPSSPAAADDKAAEGAGAVQTEAAAAVRFGIAGMEIDLGGIAKGYTSSRVMAIFKEHGIEHGIVSLGGNVQALGTKENGKAWRVAIQNPESDLDYLGVLDISDKCVITSGGYERYFDQGGVRYHHIIDPRTGFPADSGIISATIVSDDGTLADGLSTSLFIMGLEAAEKYWRANSDRFDFILEDKSGKLYVTEGAADLLTTDAKTEIIKK